MDLIFNIQEYIYANPMDMKAYEDMYRVCVDHGQVYQKVWLAQKCGRAVVKALKSGDVRKAQDFMDMHKKALLLAAPDDFDSYMLYLEINRPPEQRFYQPRRRISADSEVFRQVQAVYRHHRKP